MGGSRARAPWRGSAELAEVVSTAQAAPLPLPTPDSAWAPWGLMEPGIPFSPALIAIRWRKWKITALGEQAGNWRAVVPGACAAQREDESGPPSPLSPWRRAVGGGAWNAFMPGALSIGRGGGAESGVREPAGWPGGGGDEKAPLLPWANFLRVQEARGNSELSLQECSAQTGRDVPLWAS